MQTPQDESARITKWDLPASVPHYEKRSSFEAAWYLTHSRLWPIVRGARSGPVFLGLIFAALIVLTILFSPSTESRFIYTDF